MQRLDEELIINHSFNTPLSRAFFDDKPTLYEGLIHSYPIQKVKEYIDDLLRFPGNEFISMIQNNNKIVVKYINNEHNNKLIEQAMTLCGYIFSRQMIDGQYIEKSYIPKYSGDVTDLIHQKMKYLMHITPTYYKDKILKIGFVPKSKHSDFNYNERIYFFIQNTTAEEMIMQAKDFNRKLTNKRNLNLYTCFFIDVSKLSDDIRLYIDPTYGFGVYTMQNVPPNVIYNYIDIDPYKDFKEASKF